MAEPTLREILNGFLDLTQHPDPNIREEAEREIEMLSAQAEETADLARPLANVPGKRGSEGEKIRLAAEEELRQLGAVEHPPMLSPRPGPWAGKYQLPVDPADAVAAGRRDPPAATERGTLEHLKGAVSSNPLGLAKEAGGALVDEVKRLPGYLKDTGVALGASFNDFFGFGRAADALGLSEGDSPLRWPNPQERQAAKDASPVGDVGGQTLALALPLKFGGGPVTAAANRLRGGAGAPPGALSRVGQAVGDEAVIEGARSTIEGRDPMEVLKRAGTAGGAAGVISGGGELAGKGWEAIRNVPIMRDFFRGVSSGHYQTPKFKGERGGAEGIDDTARESLDTIMTRKAAKGKRASDDYHAEMTPEELHKELDRQDMIRQLEEGRKQSLNVDTEIPNRAAVTAAYDDEIAKFGDESRQVGGAGEKHWERIPITAHGTLQRRRALKDEAFGSPNPSPEERAKQSVYQTFRGAVHNASPKIKAADEKYTAYAKQAERENDILFNTEENVIPGAGSGAPETALPIEAADDLAETVGKGEKLRVAKDRSARKTLKRYGTDVTEPALSAQPYLDELADMDPAYRQALEQIALKKAYEGTRFNLGNALPNSLTGATGLAGIKPLITQQGRFLGRLAEPVLGEAQMAGRAGSRLLPLLRDPIDAILERRKKKQE